MALLRGVWDLYLSRPDFFRSLIVEHIQLAGTAVLIAVVIGLFLGIVIARYRAISMIILSIVNFLYTIPAIAFFGILIAFSGIGTKTAVIVLSVYALLPMVRGTYTGILSVDSDVLEAAIGMGTGSLQLLWKVQLPLALPVILSGFRNMVVMVISTAGIASFVGAGGLGVAIWRGITTYNNAMTAAGSLLIALMALFAEYIIGVLQNILEKRWLGFK